MQKIRHMSKKLDIVSLYLHNYSSFFSAREIARKLNLSPQTALSVSDALTKEKILLMKKNGRNKNYYLNLDNHLTLFFLGLSEQYCAFKTLSNPELNIIISELLPFCRGIILFGSFAKGNARKHSDLDLIIIESKNKKRIKDLKRSYPREINLEFVSLVDLKKSLTQKQTLVKEILASHILFGDVIKIVNLFAEYFKK